MTTEQNNTVPTVPNKAKNLLIPSDFEKQNGQSNFTRWKNHMIDLLQHHDEWDDSTNSPHLSSAALQLLSLTVEYSVKDNYLDNVPRPLNAISMWKALNETLSPNMILFKTQLLQDIVNFSFDLGSEAEEIY
jgi:hypothetical protein